MASSLQPELCPVCGENSLGGAKLGANSMQTGGIHEASCELIDRIWYLDMCGDRKRCEHPWPCCAQGTWVEGAISREALGQSQSCRHKRGALHSQSRTLSPGLQCLYHQSPPTQPSSESESDPAATPSAASSRSDKSSRSDRSSSAAAAANTDASIGTLSISAAAAP